MNHRDEPARREFLRTTGLFTAWAGLWFERLFQQLAQADEIKPAGGGTIGRREIIKGLDGMSRVADSGNSPFIGGHNAAAVITSAFFCRNEKLAPATQQELLALIEARLLTSPIYQPQPDEAADAALVAGLVDDLDAGIDTLRSSGHNIIFAVVSPKALGELPEAATPARVGGLRKMVQSFGTTRNRGTPLPNPASFVDLTDEPRFIRFIFEEYLQALELYLNGKGHHGFAGHLLTVGHALLQLKRMGHVETANKGIEAYWQFVHQARKGTFLGGQRVKDAPPDSPTPLEQDYWTEQTRRPLGLIPSCHLIKYPYSFYDLARDLSDESIKQRIFERMYYLTAVS